MSNDVKSIKNIIVHTIVDYHIASSCLKAKQYLTCTSVSTRKKGCARFRTEVPLSFLSTSRLTSLDLSISHPLRSSIARNRKVKDLENGTVSKLSDVIGDSVAVLDIYMTW